MSEEIKNVKDEVISVDFNGMAFSVPMKEEVKEEYISPFISNDDTFDVKVEYYKEGKDFIVEGVDNTFNKEIKNRQAITFTFKRPNQGDVALIMAEGNSMTHGKENDDVRSYLLLEFARILVLIRGWSLAEELNNVNMLSLSPKIVKSLISKVREEIGAEGII